MKQHYYLSILIFLFISTGCEQEKGGGLDIDALTTTYQTPNTYSTPTQAENNDIDLIWKTFIDYRKAAEGAESFDDVAPYLSSQVLLEMEGVSEETKLFYFGLMMALEGIGTKVKYIKGYQLDQDASIYFSFAEFDGENDVVSSVTMIKEEDGWKIGVLSINNDETVPALWNEDLIASINTDSTGTIGYKDVSMDVLSAIAFKDERENEITFKLFPFTLNRDDLLLHRDGILQPGLLDKKTPDPTKWEDWSPMAMFTIHFDEQGIQTREITNVCLNLNWFEEPNNFNFVCDLTMKSSITLIDLPAQDNGVIRFQATGVTNLTDTYSWDFSITTHLLKLEHVDSN
jgi:hypothetical protein